jgi:hypothetical protein
MSGGMLCPLFYHFLLAQAPPSSEQTIYHLSHMMAQTHIQFFDHIVFVDGSIPMFGEIILCSWFNHFISCFLVVQSPLSSTQNHFNRHV